MDIEYWEKLECGVTVSTAVKYLPNMLMQAYKNLPPFNLLFKSILIIDAFYGADWLFIFKI